MEFEDVEEKDERAKWECRRVAAVLDVDGLPESTFEKEAWNQRWFDFELWKKGVCVSWSFDRWHMQLKRLSLGKMRDKDDCCEVRYGGIMGWSYRAHSDYDDLMARGLYRLGFKEDGRGLSQLPTLSAHEKLELRLSMPREL